MLILPVKRDVELILESCSLMLHMIWPAEEQQCFSCVCCISCVSGSKMERMTLITQQHAWLDLTGIERSCYECAFLDDTVVTGLELMTTGPLDVSLQPHLHWSQVYPPSEVGGQNISLNIYVFIYLISKKCVQKYTHTYSTSPIFVYTWHSFEENKIFSWENVTAKLQIYSRSTVKCYLIICWMGLLVCFVFLWQLLPFLSASTDNNPTSIIM